MYMIRLPVRFQICYTLHSSVEPPRSPVYFVLSLEGNRLVTFQEAPLLTLAAPSDDVLLMEMKRAFFPQKSADPFSDRFHSLACAAKLHVKQELHYLQTKGILKDKSVNSTFIPYKTQNQRLFISD